ncbi:hypothetical protein AVEN_88815-1 [Araneus ventricosus]|uniref:RNA-directed DNA polymerase from mobile element jockey n=1 Tax=Araneus ventricosus TaxID=182803 RepID=A0A4Y2PR30_ARAVE|nr:hypothetical protein AVEN_88815-1 [Araneus ventricosus]
MLRPLISYACPVWLAAAKKCTLSLESVQNNTVRRITRMPWFIRNENIRWDLDLATIREYYKKIAKTFYHKTDASTNRVFHLTTHVVIRIEEDPEQLYIAKLPLALPPPSAFPRPT